MLKNAKPKFQIHGKTVERQELEVQRSRMWKTSAIWAAGYQPMAIVTKTVKSGLAKPAGVWKAQDVWRNKLVSLKVKVRLYESLVMATMLYSAELWPLTIPQKKSWMPHTTSFNDDFWVLHGKTKCAMKTYEIRRNYKERTSSSRKED